MDKVFLKYKQLQSKGKESNMPRRKKGYRRKSLEQIINVNGHKQAAVDSSALPASVGNILLKSLLLAMTSVGEHKRERRLHCAGRTQLNALLETVVRAVLSFSAKTATVERDLHIKSPSHFKFLRFPFFLKHCKS